MEKDQNTQIADALFENIDKAAAIFIQTVAIARSLADTPEKADILENALRQIFIECVENGLDKGTAEIQAKIAIFKASLTAKAP